jgi:SPP1 gp7 family putative phage head morphogenesis protein
MRYDLAALARRRGVRRKAIVFRPIEPTQALAGLLAAIGEDLVREAETGIREALLPVYAPRPVLTQDDTASTVGDALATVATGLRRLALMIGPKVREWAVRVEEWHRPRFAAGVRAGTGADVVAFLTAPDAEDQVSAAAEWAASLITSLSEDLQKEVASLTWAAYAQQTPREELAKQLQERLGIAHNRARFIARDQTTKLAAALDRMRQQEAGMDRYRWRHSGKLHPRPEHVARDGKIFRWSDPPAGGHPGTEPNCGCRAQAYLSLD